MAKQNAKKARQVEFVSFPKDGLMKVKLHSRVVDACVLVRVCVCVYEKWIETRAKWKWVVSCDHVPCTQRNVNTLLTAGKKDSEGVRERKNCTTIKSKSSKKKERGESTSSGKVNQDCTNQFHSLCL